jgi:hypothetical protein
MYINKNMLIELCASNFAIANDLVNEIDKILKTSMTCNNKIIISIMFQKHLIATLPKKIKIFFITIT